MPIITKLDFDKYEIAKNLGKSPEGVESSILREIEGHYVKCRSQFFKSPNTSSIIAISWEEIVSGVKAASESFKQHGAFINGVYGVPENGLCIAVLFSNYLGVDLLPGSREGCLIVDGESSHTLFTLSHVCAGSLTFAAAWKVDSEFKPSEFGIGISDENAQVLFPWEI